MSRDIRVVTEAELREVVKLDLAAVAIVERAFAALGRGEAIQPPILSMDLAEIEGEVDIKTAYLRGLPHFAVKISTGFFGNAARGLPSLGGLMCVFDAGTGQVAAVLLDNGYLTDLRTAAAGAVAARHLAPEEVATAGVIGTGLQARLQIRAAHLVRPFERVLVWGRDLEKAAQCAADLAGSLGIEAEVCTNPAELVKRAQLVVTTTPSRLPLIEAEWLHPNLHITAMGSDAPEKSELAAAIPAAADLYVPDSVAQVEKLGELRAAKASGAWAGARPTELGEIVTGQKPGRTDPRQITVADLTGTGAQDTAIAAHVLALLG